MHVYRLKTFVDRAAISTLTGDIFDDAATGQGLLNFFLKAMNCGAITRKRSDCNRVNTLMRSEAAHFIKYYKEEEKRNNGGLNKLLKNKGDLNDRLLQFI